MKNTYDFVKGDILTDKGIMEASLNKDIQETLPDRKYLLIINVPKNTLCLHVTPYNHRDDENGVLFPRNTKLLVKEVVKDGMFNAITKVYCEVVL